jgi:hypothetical protein
VGGLRQSEMLQSDYSAKCVEGYSSSLVCEESVGGLRQSEMLQSDYSAKCVEEHSSSLVCEESVGGLRQSGMFQSDNQQLFSEGRGSNDVDIGKDSTASMVPDCDQEFMNLSVGETIHYNLCVVDDTEDSEIDQEERPTWKTTLKNDPYPLSEHLMLSLEEVSKFRVCCLHKG